MTTERGKPYCITCDKPIEGKAEVIEGFSASGARPDAYRHPTCGPRQEPFVRRVL
ncbi:hypothetical protein [Streptomyces sp. TRM64462]|uniref:hypothetical protein n=1 Tax=Streptomyces sp. TRM64462 TaxID=2741726 RepID=UPI001586479B|nr:hypothetical protein [Streptomyces sp. TRM64462]